MTKFKIFQDERPWGDFRQFTHNTSSTVKIITLKPEGALSLQSHSKRSEFWHIIRGSGVIEIGDKKFNVSEGDEYNIPVNTKHRAIAGPLCLIFLEISYGDFDENDEIRYEDKYDRV